MGYHYFGVSHRRSNVAAIYLPINQLVLRNMVQWGEERNCHTGTPVRGSDSDSVGSACPWIYEQSYQDRSSPVVKKRVLFSSKVSKLCNWQRDQPSRQMFRWCDVEVKASSPLAFYRRLSKSWPQKPQVTIQHPIAFYPRIFCHVPESRCRMFILFILYTDTMKRVLRYLNRRMISGLFCPVTLICCFCATLQ